jgi:DNA-binding NarL/FixJ family response regulator
VIYLPLTGINFTRMMITVHIYDDNAGLRQSLEQVLSLSGEFAITGSFDNFLESGDEPVKNPPDVILMDIDMPGMNGIEAVRKIRTFNKKIPIIMLTVFDDNVHILDAICAGASGYLLKKSIFEKLVLSIKETLAEGAALSPSVAKMIINSMQKKTGKDQYDFSPREKEILTLLCKGYSYKMIAANLNIGFETVRTHIKNVYEKLQVGSATEAVSKAINERLI